MFETERKRHRYNGELCLAGDGWIPTPNPYNIVVESRRLYHAKPAELGSPVPELSRIFAATAARQQYVSMLSENDWTSKLNPVVVTTEFEEEYSKLQKRISYLCLDAQFTTPLGVDVQDLAIETLASFNDGGILPTLINPTGDDSLLLEFFIDQDVYAIEFYVSGEIVYTYRRGDQKPVIAEIDKEHIGKIVKDISYYAKSNVR